MTDGSETSKYGRVLITGATGFVGVHVAQSLLRKGIPVRGALRHGSSLSLHGLSVAYIRDLSDRDGLAGALRGVDTVIHLAGRAHVLRETSTDALTEFRRVNVEGTRVLVEEAVSVGVERFVFVSSVGAVAVESSTAITEETPPAPVTPYGISKLEAERVVRDLADRAGMHAPIVRPPLVYGPRMKGNPLRLLKLVAKGWPIPLGSVHNCRSMVYVGNLVKAIEAVLATPEAARETFFVSDGQDLSTSALVVEMARALGQPVRLIAVPPVLFRAAGRVGDTLSHFLSCPVTSDAVSRLLGSLVIDSSKLRRVTGFRPSYTVQEAMYHTAEWYRTQRTKQSECSGL